MGKSDLLARLVNLYARDSADSLNVIRQAVRTRAPEDLKEALHKLIGTSSNIGAQRVAELCRTLEGRTDSTNVDQVDELMVELETELTVANRTLAASIARRG